MVQKIIEGYGINDVNPYVKYINRRDNRKADRQRLDQQYSDAQRSYNNLVSTSNREIPWMNDRISAITNQNYTTQNQIDNLNLEISTLNTQNSNLEFDNKTHGVTIDKLRYNVPIQKAEYDDKQNKSRGKTNQILPLKKKEMVGTKNYHQLLMFQNQEIKDEIYSQKNNLTTADRNYSIHDSRIPYYVVVNKLLLFTYIAILLYVSYRVLNGMIVNNIYGKIVIVLLIALYPIYIFDLEMVIYDQYNLIKSMIRAEPYIPAVI